MKIFISWSGERSGIIAKGLSVWLPNVIQSVEIFYSPDIEKGTRGGAEINSVLAETNFGIICLTRENLQSTWIHYESGALAKINDKNTRVWTLLCGLKHSDVIQPLAQFQHTLTEKEDIFALLQSINLSQEKSLPIETLRKTFEKWWSDLEEIIQKAEAVENSAKAESIQIENLRTDRDIFNEMLEILREIQRDKFSPYELGSRSTLIQSIIAERLITGLIIHTSDNVNFKDIAAFANFTNSFFSNIEVKTELNTSGDGYKIAFKHGINRQSISEYLNAITVQGVQIRSYRLVDENGQLSAEKF